jgi:hypothetical protein
MVCDGHQGAGAANHCVENMPGLLGQLLPAGLPDWRDTRYVAAVDNFLSLLFQHFQQLLYFTSGSSW